MQYKWPEEHRIQINYSEKCFCRQSGITLAKNDTISFTTKSESQYGSMRLHFNNLDLSKNPVLQFVQSDNIVKSIPLTTQRMECQII